MNKLIEQALDSIGIKNFYITRGAYSDECAVYTYISAPSCYADNKSNGTEYTILVNVYSKTGIEEKKNAVIKALNFFGIKGGRAKVPILEKNNLFNTAIQFNGFMREEV